MYKKYKVHTTDFLQLQKQPPQVFCKKKCSQKFRKFGWKTPVLESLFYKVVLQHRCFPVKFVKFLRTPILKNI